VHFRDKVTIGCC